MKNILSSLFNYRVKRFAILFAIFVFILDMILHQFQNQLNVHEHHILLQYIVMLALMTAISSKDKIDDELSKEVRYGIYKHSFSIAIAMFGILALFLSTQSITTLNTLTIMYCLQGTMVIHLILYYFGVKYHPEWLLNEKTAPKDYNNLMVGALIGIFVMFTIIIFLSLLVN
jgi:hypothetical protein